MLPINSMWKLVLPVSILSATVLFAADPAGFVVWKSSDLKALEKPLAAKMKGAPSVNQELGQYGNHRTLVNHREGKGEVEVHADWNDMFVVQTGEAELLIGGKVINGKTTGPGEIRGTASEGAEKKMIAAGDIVHVPPGVPHQFIVAPGKQITYFAVKIPGEKK